MLRGALGTMRDGRFWRFAWNSWLAMLLRAFGLHMRATHRERRAHTALTELVDDAVGVS